MNPILEWGIALIAWLQASLPWLGGPSQWLSFLGSEEFFLLLLPFVYWSVDARLGARVGVILCVSSNVNDLLKFVFHAPRPYWMSRQVQALSSEPSYGLPSGHAQRAVSIGGVIGAAGQNWLRWVIAGLAFLIGLSRIFLAVHFPTDVLLGWLIGGLVLWAFTRWEAPVLVWFNRFTLWQKIGLACAASLLLIAIPLAGLACAPAADPPEWATMASLNYPPPAGEPAIAPRDTTRVVGVAGALFGLVAGLVLLAHQTQFDARGEWWKRALRFALGVVGVLVLWVGLRQVLPRDASLAAQTLRYLRYAVTGFWIAYGAPRLFIKLKL